MAHPLCCRRWPSARPTRPAPTMEIPYFIAMLGYRVDCHEHQSMHIFGLIFFGMIAFFWLSHGLRVAIGAAQLPWLRDHSPAQNEDCPSVSVLFAARDEEQKLPEALGTLLQLDYPKLEIVAVDDRSSDETGKILDDAAKRDPRLKVVHVEHLPEGWLVEPPAHQ